MLGATPSSQVCQGQQIRAAHSSASCCQQQEVGWGRSNTKGPGLQPHSQEGSRVTLSTVPRRIDGGASGQAVKCTRGEPFTRQPRPSYFPGVKGEARALGPSEASPAPIANTNRAVGFCPTTWNWPCRTHPAGAQRQRPWKSGDIWERGGKNHHQPRVRGLASEPQTKGVTDSSPRAAHRR